MSIHSIHIEEKASYRKRGVQVARALAGASTSATLVAMGGDWLLIAGAMWISSRYSGSLLLYALSCLLIASRQHALLVLMHEGAHGHLFPSPRWNDLLGNVTTAWPFAMSLERYREHHWKHHQFTNTAQDPDWGRKVESPHWSFPKSSIRFWADFLPYLKGLGLRELWFARRVIGIDRAHARSALFVYGVVATALTLSGGWRIWALYWLVPFLTLVPVLMKVRSIVEHLGLPRTNELDSSRNIVGSPVEAFFFGPHGNNLHLIHHLYPQVPWHRMAKLRNLLLEWDGFRGGAYENRGYFLPGARSVYCDLVVPAKGQIPRDKAAA